MNQEQYMNLKENEHYKLLNKTFDKINKVEIKSILDSGSGRTSLSSLLKYFDKSKIDAIIYPGDLRKRISIETNIKSERYNLLELDICKRQINSKYDLVLAHLLLGEATKWNNSFDDLLNSLFSVKSKYYIIYDIKEDPKINYNYIEQYLKENDFKIIFKDEIAKKEKQIYQDFIALNYISYLVKKT